MPKFFDRVKMNLTTTGTGTVTFGSVVDGFQSLADASVVDADVVRYTLESGTNYEVGTGTIGLAGGTYTMARSPSSSSQSDNSAINLGAGAVCFLTMLAEDVVQALSDLDNVSSTAPAGGQNLAWDSGTSSWVPASPSGGITTVGNYAGLPASPNETDLAWVSDQKAIYIYDGAEWDRFSTGSQFAPRFTTLPSSELVLESDGTTSDIVVVAIDDAGFPITYDWDAFDSSNSVYSTGTLPDMLTSVSESSGTFTLTPSTNTSHVGSLTFRTKASDGVATVVGLTTLTLQFSTPIDVSTAGSSNRMTINANSATGALSITSILNSSETLEVGYAPTAGLKLGKQYIEFDMDAIPSGRRIMFGIGDLAKATAGTLGWNTSGNFGTSIYTDTPRFYPYSGVSPTTASLDDNTAHTIMFAYDTTAERVWIGVDGTWDASSNTGGAPGTGAGIDVSGIDFTTGLCFIFGSTHAGHSLTGQFKSGTGNNPTYTVPTGFNAY